MGQQSATALKRRCSCRNASKVKRRSLISETSSWYRCPTVSLVAIVKVPLRF